MERKETKQYHGKESMNGVRGIQGMEFEGYKEWSWKRTRSSGKQCADIGDDHSLFRLSQNTYHYDTERA